MPNLSFRYLSKSIWKDKNSVKKLKELWRKITHTYKGVFHQRGSTVSALFSSPLPSAGSHHVTHITKDIRHQDAAVSTGRGSARIALLPCTWAPQGCFKVQFNSPALIQKDNLLLTSWEVSVCSLHCPIPHSRVLQFKSPLPSLLMLQLHLPLLLPLRLCVGRESCLLPLLNPLLVLPTKWWQKHLLFLSEHCLVWGEPKEKEGRGTFLASCGRDKQKLAVRQWIWLMSY